MSIMTILIFSTIELVLGLEQLQATTYGLPLGVLQLVIAVVFFKIFFLLILKTTSTILKSQVLEMYQNNPNFNLKMFLLKIYFQAHLTILVFFYICLRYSDRPQVYLFWTIALIPQIVSNSCSQNRFLISNQEMNIFYLTLILSAFYNHFYLQNPFYISQDQFSQSQGLVVLIYALHFILINLIQENYSPYFFIPHFLKKQWKMHDYFQTPQPCYDKELSEEDSTCVFCLNSLEEHMQNDEWEKEINNEHIKDYIKEKCHKHNVMVTPCNHSFHSTCLLSWMAIKMECPLCKSSLPSFVN